ncbi:MAG: phage baseplate protein [Williamsia sp.]|nr:phage baseplate protein [Williamsia sp.]
MRPLTTTELLDVWEQGSRRSLLQRSLLLLQVACAFPDAGTVARFSIGERDARLLKLREWMFGDRFVNTANCPQCGEQIEWTVPIEDLRLQPWSRQEGSPTFTLQDGGYEVRFRLPNSEDMALIASLPAYQPDPGKLLADCILRASHHGEECSPDTLPAALLEAINQRMAAEDPQADIRMVLSCPQCACTWEAPFHILSYLWTEIDAWARRILQEVYLLARAFSWSEQDILNLSPYRRQLYLEMIRS